MSPRELRLGVGGLSRRTKRAHEPPDADDGTWAIDADHPDVDPSQLAYPIDEWPFWPMRLETRNEPSRWATVNAISVLARLAADRT